MAAPITFNPSDTTYAIVSETVAGTIPATPAFLQLPYIAGTTPSWDSDSLTSNVRTGMRGAAPGRWVNYRVGGGNKVHFKRDASIDLMLASALSGVWTGTGNTTLAAGLTESNYTIEETFKAGSTLLINRYSGCQCAEFSFDADFNGNIEADFTHIGLNRTQGTAILTGATYTPYNSTTVALTGAEITNLTIAGLTGIEGTKLSLKVTSTREAQGKFGQISARGVGTSARTVTGSISLYRADFSPETVLNPSGGVNPPVAMSFNIGTGTSGYGFSIPNCQFAPATNSEDNSKLLVNLDFTGTIVGTTPDITITHLA